MRTRVCVIGMLDSVHLARWLQQFRDQPLDFVLLASSPHRKIHPALKSLLSGSGTSRYRALRPYWLFGAPLWVADKFLGNRIRALALWAIVRIWSPKYVHAFELQNAGYVALRYLRWTKSKDRPARLILTNYGSDIFWFSKFPKHKKKLEELLLAADSYSCECKRDVRLAEELGFKGSVMPVFPNAGGFSAEELGTPLTLLDDRTSIAIKGYQGWVGRAITALDAVEIIADQLGKIRIELYSCNWSTIRRAKKLRRQTGLDITWSPKGKLRHEQMMELFSRSRVYVGISDSDGISTSLLEAMACGAIPVQTSTACCDEWFTNTGVRVDTISPEAVADAIIAALQLARDPSNAERNRKTIAEKASKEKVREASLKYYR